MFVQRTQSRGTVVPQSFSSQEGLSSKPEKDPYGRVSREENPGGANPNTEGRNNSGTDWVRTEQNY